MSLLGEIKDALEARHDVDVVSVRNEHYFPHPNPENCSQEVDFFLATQTPVLKGKQLQKLLNGLVPGRIAPYDRPFQVQPSGRMNVGVLYYWEVIGTKDERLTVTADDLGDLPGFDTDGVCILGAPVDLRRRIAIFLYPTAELARSASSGSGKYEIGKDALETLKAKSGGTAA